MRTGRYVRGAAKALGLLDDKRAVTPLIALLLGEGADIRWSAAWALAVIGDKRALPALLIALRDENADVRKVAERALKQMRREYAK
jgi:HEAT repeat protein